MKRILKKILAITLGLGFIVSVLPVAYAQESSTEEFTLEEITVTSQKRKENQQKVAIAMEVLSGDQLKELGKNDIDTILDNVSSVMINTNSDGLRVSIRGMSNDNPVMGFMQASTPTVAVNTDGVYTNRNSANQNLYDIERVEVLYGPQSTLYASATPGGIVNIVTSDPKIDKYEASGTLEYGNYNLLHTEGSLNAPVGHKMALRAAFSTAVHDGYLSNGSYDEDTKSARLKALFQPNDKISFVITGELSKSGGSGFSTAKGFVNQDDEYYTDGTKITDLWTSDSNSAALGLDRENKKISGRMDWDMGYAGTLSVIPSYSRGSNYSKGVMAGMAPPGMPAIQQLSTNTGIQTEKDIEARMVSSADFPFKWILGVNVYKSVDTQNSENVEQNVVNPATTYGVNSNTQNTKAIYGNFTYPIMENFRVTGGLRKTWDTNHTYSYDSGRGGAPEIHEQDFNGMNYKVGFEYDLGTTSMLYGDWSTSYRTQGMAFDSTGKPFPPEKLAAYTLGAKNRFLGNKLQANIAAYDYEYKNYMGAIGAPLMIQKDANNNGVIDPDEQTSPPIEDPGSKQIGDARIYGVDLQTSTIITNTDRLDFSVSYIKKYFKYLYFDYSDLANNFYHVADVDYSGKEMSLAPHWTINASYNHNFILGNGGALTARLEARYQSKYTLQWGEGTLSYGKDPDTGEYYSIFTPASPYRFQEAYHTENFSMVYAHSDGKWTLTAYVNNLSNYAVKRSLIAMGGPGSLMLNPPRTYGGVLSVKF